MNSYYKYRTNVSAEENEFELIPELETSLTYEVSHGTRESKEYIKWLQASLNKILKLKPLLSVNGIMGPGTKARIKFFQRSKGLPQTGKIDNATEAALQKAGATPPPVHVASSPPDCLDKKDIKKEFWDKMTKVEAKIRSITRPPLTARILNEIRSILSRERNVDFHAFDIFLCRKITSILLPGEPIGAEVFAKDKILFISEGTWGLVSEFLSTGDLSLITTFFQTIAHEKRHATLENIIEVDVKEVKPGLDSMAAGQARYRAHEILVKAEEIAVGRTMNPAYRVPIELQQTFRRNANIVKSIVTAAKFKELRDTIIKELRKRYSGGKACDSSLSIGVLKSMETGNWFLCSGGSIVGGIPVGLKPCSIC